jgi:hypothetical protein
MSPNQEKKLDRTIDQLDKVIYLLHSLTVRDDKDHDLSHECQLCEYINLIKLEKRD